MEEDAPEIIVTNHAKKRFKKRLGLPKNSCQRHAEIAFNEGFHHCNAKGRAKRYIDKLFLSHKMANNIRVYGEFVYVFKGNTLITVFGLPKNLRGGFSA